MAIENLAPVMLTNGLANAVSGSEGSSGGESSSWSEGGSSNTAYSVSGSEGSSQSTNWSNVAGLEASANSAKEAERAHERQKELLQMAQVYNSREAEKQRNWTADMANTIYTRSVKTWLRRESIRYSRLISDYQQETSTEQLQLQLQRRLHSWDKRLQNKIAQDNLLRVLTHSAIAPNEDHLSAVADQILMNGVTAKAD